MKITTLLSVIEAAGRPALRVVFTLAVVAMMGVALFTYHRRHKFFAPDAEVDGDTSVTGHARLEEILLVWGGLMLLLISLLVQIWTA